MVPTWLLLVHPTKGIRTAALTSATPSRRVPTARLRAATGDGVAERGVLLPAFERRERWRSCARRAPESSMRQQQRAAYSTSVAATFCSRARGAPVPSPRAAAAPSSPRRRRARSRRGAAWSRAHRRRLAARPAAACGGGDSDGDVPASAPCERLPRHSTPTTRRRRRWRRRRARDRIVERVGLRLGRPVRRRDAHTARELPRWRAAPRPRARAPPPASRAARRLEVACRRRLARRRCRLARRRPRAVSLAARASACSCAVASAARRLLALAAAAAAVAAAVASAAAASAAATACRRRRRRRLLSHFRRSCRLRFASCTRASASPPRRARLRLTRAAASASRASASRRPSSARFRRPSSDARVGGGARASSTSQRDSASASRAPRLETRLQNLILRLGRRVRLPHLSRAAARPEASNSARAAQPRAPSATASAASTHAAHHATARRTATAPEGGTPRSPFRPRARHRRRRPPALGEEDVGGREPVIILAGEASMELRQPRLHRPQVHSHLRQFDVG